jgi:phospholipid transport system substrate-binding protein
MRVFKTMLLCICFFLPQISLAQTSPVSMLEQSANQIVETLKVNRTSLKTNPHIIYQAVQRYFLPHVDVLGMSRSVLGRQVWQKATPEERTRFSKVFTELVIRTYSGPLAEYKNETVKFLPVRDSLTKRFLRINSLIVRSEGQNIPLSYSLVSKDGQWKVYDISVEGVSLLQSFRSQFAQILQNANVDEVIKKMQKKQENKAS